jgi:hypothetical protein
MLGPAYALNFTAEVLDPRIVFTRALNTATRINSSGFVEIVNANLPRFDYTLNTGGACRGLLIEETRTNSAREWSNFASTQWSKTASGGGTVPSNTGNTLTAPDGVGSAQVWQFIAPTTSDRSIISQTSTLTSGFYATSVFMKAGRPQDVGKIISIKESQGATYTLLTLTDQWQRPESIATSANTQRGVAFELRPLVGTSTGTVQVAIWGAQVEPGAFVTSAIPNTGTTTTSRNADVATITGTNFSEWWRTGKGSALARARPSTVSGTRSLIQFDDNTANNIIALRGNTTNPELYIRASGSDQAQIDAGTIAANTRYRLAGAWATNDCAASLNSGTPVRDGVATIPVVTQARLGSDGTNYLNGHLEAIEYYDERALNASLQVLSSAAGYRSIIGPVFRDSIIS